LLPGQLTPRLQGCLARLGTHAPFAPAAAILAQLLRVTVSPSTARRVTQRAGAAAEAVQEQERERLEREAPPPPAGPEKLLLSTDGALVPLRHGTWAEVRTLVLGQVGEPVRDASGETTVPCTELSYFSRLLDAEPFTTAAYVEVYRRGVERAGAVGAVSDGADWCQNFVAFHRPDAVRILDFPHAGQRIGEVGRIVFGAAGEPAEPAREWTQKQLHALKHEGPEGVLKTLTALAAAHPEEERLAENLAYLQRREMQMQYPQFRAAGWPIGSGVVESANKLVVEARLKGPGMHWERTHVNAMLALRTGECSGRWEETWLAASRKRRQQRRTRRAAEPHEVPSAAVAAVSQAPVVEAAQSGAAAPTGSEAAVEASAPTKAKPSGTRRPAPDHPWRQYGRKLGSCRRLPRHLYAEV
jgi:hypothetical protein